MSLNCLGFSPRNGESVLKFLNFSPMKNSKKFQSPQWGKCSKAKYESYSFMKGESFSPRNGESVLKTILEIFAVLISGFSPRNGESVLKLIKSTKRQ